MVEGIQARPTKHVALRDATPAPKCNCYGPTGNKQKQTVERAKTLDCSETAGMKRCDEFHRQTQTKKHRETLRAVERRTPKELLSENRNDCDTKRLLPEWRASEMEGAYHCMACRVATRCSRRDRQRIERGY